MTLARFTPSTRKRNWGMRWPSDSALEGTEQQRTSDLVCRTWRRERTTRSSRGRQVRPAQRSSGSSRQPDSSLSEPIARVHHPSRNSQNCAEPARLTRADLTLSALWPNARSTKTFSDRLEQCLLNIGIPAGSRVIPAKPPGSQVGVPASAGPPIRPGFRLNAGLQQERAKSRVGVPALAGLLTRRRC